MKIKLNQSGIAHIGLILISLLVIGVVGFAAYRISNSKSKDPEPAQIIKAEPKEKEVKKKTYQFELTDLKIDMPENWEVSVAERTDATDDGKNDSYTGTIKGDNGWGIKFNANQGGFGGGSGCNYQGEMPEEADCPTYRLLSTDILPTKHILAVYASNDATKNGFSNNCAIVTNSDQTDQTTVGSSFEGTAWTCFGAINPNESSKDPTTENKPSAMIISVIFPYDLDKKASTDFTKDTDYQAVLEALKTLRKS